MGSYSWNMDKSQECRAKRKLVQNCSMPHSLSKCEEKKKYMFVQIWKNRAKIGPIGSFRRGNGGLQNREGGKTFPSVTW